MHLGEHRLLAFPLRPVRLKGDVVDRVPAARAEPDSPPSTGRSFAVVIPTPVRSQTLRVLGRLRNGDFAAPTDSRSSIWGNLDLGRS